MSPPVNYETFLQKKNYKETKYNEQKFNQHRLFRYLALGKVGTQ